MRGGQEVCRDCQLREEKIYEGGDGMLEGEMEELKKIIRRKEERVDRFKKELFGMREEKRQYPLRPINGIDDLEREIDKTKEEIEDLREELREAKERKAENPLIP